uniref:RCC1 domain-containing protein n=1 Tax=Chitinimonas sp. TaxID=1934313 RepID=UPI0035AF19A8
SEGQLAQGRDDRLSVPVKLASQVKQFALGDSVAFAISQDGSLWAWGSNRDGRLGDGGTTAQAAPVKIGDGFTSVSTGNTQSFAIKADGSLWAWGANDFGQLGLGDTNNRLSPSLVGSGYLAVAAGAEHTLALKTDGSLWAWGRNRYGQLGNGLFEQRFGTQANPTPIKIGSGFSAILAGYHHSLALKNDGSLWAWGWNDYGQVGDGSTDSRATPVQVASNIASLQSAGINSMVLGKDGKTYGWGYNGAARRGYNMLLAGADTFNITRPQPIAGDWIAASAGSAHAAYLRRDGLIFAVGYQQFGQLGDGAYDDVRTSLASVLNSEVKGPLDLLPDVPNQGGSSDAPPVLLRTVRQTSGSQLALGLEFRIPARTLSAPLAAASRHATTRNAFSVTGYSVFVAASLPGSNQVLTWWSLQPKAKYPDLTWDHLLFPLSAFLDNLSASDDALITTDIISNIDINLLAGANLYLGYGLSADEMLASGRYRTFFTVPK